MINSSILTPSPQDDLHSIIKLAYCWESLLSTFFSCEVPNKPNCREPQTFTPSLPHHISHDNMDSSWLKTRQISDFPAMVFTVCNASISLIPFNDFCLKRPRYWIISPIRNIKVWSGWRRNLLRKLTFYFSKETFNS